MHHPGYGAVKTGACYEPRQRRIGTHERRGWRLLADFTTPTARDAEAIERAVLVSLATRRWVAEGWGAWKIDGLPGHGTISGCRHCGAPPATPRLRLVHDSFLTTEQMPQGGKTETFDARIITPERLRLALYFAEAAHRSLRYPDRADGRDPFEVRREQVTRAVEAERLRRVVY